MSRQVLLAGWVVVALAFAGCEMLALLGRGRVRGLLGLMGFLTRRDRVLVAVFVGWMWLGWHFFAR